MTEAIADSGLVRYTSAASAWRRLGLAFASALVVLVLGFSGRDVRAQSAESNGLIFVDASASVRAFAVAYRQSMLGLAGRARDQHQNHRTTIHFVPIGDGSGSARVLPNTGMRFEVLQEALATPFSFGAQTTLLSKSLEIGRTVPNVSRVMLVSDFIPDHTPAGPTFAFSRQDMADLLTAQSIIKAYLASPKLEHFGLVLLGWDRDPAAYLTAAEQANPEEVINRAKKRNADRLGTTSGPDREDNNEDIYRKATAAVILSLQRHSPKLTVTPMAQQVGNTRNEQGFFIEACRVFDNVLAGDPRCGGEGRDASVCSVGPRGTVRNTFTVAVDRGRFSRDEFILNLLKEKFRAPLVGPQLITPRRVTIVDKSELSNTRPDYELKLCPLRAADGRECDGPYAPPDLRKLGWQLSGRRADQDRALEIVEPVRPVESAGGINADDSVRGGLANDLDRVLRRHIGETHRPPRQDLWVTLKTRAGLAIPRGHRVVAKYTISGQPARAEGIVLDETGTVVLPLPAAAEGVELLHFSTRTRSGTPAPGDAEIKLGTPVPQQSVGSCEIYSHVVQENLFIPYKVKATWPESPRLAASSKIGRLSITLQDTDYEQPVERQTITGNDEQIVKLPPGNYSVTLKVDDPRLLQPDSVPKTWLADSALAGVVNPDFGAPPPPDRDTLQFLVELDGLLRPDGQLANEQVIEVPNYLASPAEVWTVLKGLMSGDRLTPRGQRTVVQSANAFWGALSVAAEVIDRQAIGNAATDIDPVQLRKFLRQLLEQVVEPSNRDATIARDIARGLHRIGLATEEGLEHPSARSLVGLLLYRLSEGNLCSIATTARAAEQRNPVYSSEVIAEYNSWLLQSSVRPEQLVGSQASARMSARAPSQTPFRIELARRCHVPLERDGS